MLEFFLANGSRLFGTTGSLRLSPLIDLFIIILLLSHHPYHVPCYKVNLIYEYVQDNVHLIGNSCLD